MRRDRRWSAIVILLGITADRVPCGTIGLRIRATAIPIPRLLHYRALRARPSSKTRVAVLFTELWSQGRTYPVN